MAHQKFLDAVTRMSQDSWGQAVTKEEIDIALVKDPAKLSAMCLLGLIKRFDDLMEAVSSIAIKKKTDLLRENMRNARKAWIDERELSHGEAPPVVEAWLCRECDRLAGYLISNPCFEIDEALRLLNGSRLNIPEKGTPVRKEYDIWMRRGKPKPPPKPKPEKFIDKAYATEFEC